MRVSAWIMILIYLILALLVSLVFAQAGQNAAPQTQQVIPLRCSSMKTTIGTTGSSSPQPLNTLDQSGRQNNWSKYVEFYPKAAGHATECTYPLPAGVILGRVTSIGVRVNYRGTQGSRQRWEWALQDRTGNWVPVGDNSAVAGRQWTEMTFTVRGNPSDYIVDRTLRLVYRTTRNGDASDLDYQAVELRIDGLRMYRLHLPLVRIGPPRPFESPVDTPTRPTNPSGTPVSQTATPRPSKTATATSSPLSATPTRTWTPVPPGATATPTSTSTQTAPPSPTATTIATAATATRTATASTRRSRRHTATRTATATVTMAPPTVTATRTATATATPTTGQVTWATVRSWVYQLSSYQNNRLDQIAGSRFDLAVVDLARDGGGDYFTPGEVAALTGRGKLALAYFEIGAIEDYRPEWSQVPADLKLGPVGGWPSEQYVKYWDERWWPIVRGAWIRPLRPVSMGRISIWW